MQNSAIKVAKTLIIWNIRSGKMPTRYDNVIKLLCVTLIIYQIMSSYCKSVTLFTKFHISNGSTESNFLSNIGFYNSALDIIKQDLPRWIGSDWVVKMFLKIIISKL